MQTVADICFKLESLAEPKYRDFSARLIPGCLPLFGVRLPLLRSVAKELAADKPLYTDYFSYTLSGQAAHHEEVLLHGLTIGYIKDDIETILGLLDAFMPLVTNWAVCDSTCATLHMVKKNRERVWEFLQPYLKSGRPYYIRTAVVSMLDHFITEEYLYRILAALDSVRSSEYYVKMAVAWCLSICYVTYPEQVLPYLECNKLDNDTYNKTLQKITESFRCPPEMKQRIKAMKRTL